MKLLSFIDTCHIISVVTFFSFESSVTFLECISFMTLRKSFQRKVTTLAFSLEKSHNQKTDIELTVVRVTQFNNRRLYDVLNRN
jgi:hypothetical protein